jgi:hypothetical protein
LAGKISSFIAAFMLPFFRDKLNKIFMNSGMYLSMQFYSIGISRLEFWTNSESFSFRYEKPEEEKSECVQYFDFRGGNRRDERNDYETDEQIQRK